MPSVTKIVNLSLGSGTFPDVFKRAHVTPLLKNSFLDPETMVNFRPVSNLSFVSKLPERVVAVQIGEHLTQHNLHPPLQSVYRKDHSTETALILSVHHSSSTTFSISLMTGIQLSCHF